MTVIEMVRLVSDEFADITDEQINQWIEFCTPMVSKKQFGKLFERALALYICHKMKMAGLGTNTLGEFGKVANAYQASSVSDGGSSISFASTGAGNLQSDAEYAMTIYGSQFLELRRMAIVPIHIRGEGDLIGL